jgi:hypothetical protein
MAGALSPGPVQRRNVTLLNDPAQGEVPVLFNDRAQGSLSFGLRVIASSLEVGYTFDSLRLGRGVGRCRGTGSSFVLANGTIDDSAVRYDCDMERFSIDGLSRPVPSMTVHHLGGGLRFYRTRRSVVRGERESQGVQLYAVLGDAAGTCPDGVQRWQLRVWWKPFVTFIWYGGLLIALGGVLAIAGRVRVDLKRRTAVAKGAARRADLEALGAAAPVPAE